VVRVRCGEEWQCRGLNAIPFGWIHGPDSGVALRTGKNWASARASIERLEGEWTRLDPQPGG